MMESMQNYVRNLNYAVQLEDMEWIRNVVHLIDLEVKILEIKIEGKQAV